MIQSGRLFWAIAVYCISSLGATGVWAANLTINPSGTTTTGNFSVSVSGVYEFKIYEKKGSTGTYSLWVSGNYYNTGPFSRSKTDDGIYYYKLENYQQNGSKDTDVIKNITVAIPRPTPGTPTITLSATDTDGSFLVDWNTTSNAQTYKWAEKNPSGQWSSLVETNLSYVNRSNRSDGLWTYRVFACNGSQCSSSSAEKSIKVARPPSTPININTPGTNDGDYTLTWQSGGGSVSAYVLEQKYNSGNYSQIYRSSYPQEAFNLSKSSYRGVGTYRYRVKACNTVAGWDSCSGWRYTNNISVAQPSAAPGISMGTTSGNGVYSLSWGTIANTLTYKLEENVAGSSTWSTIQNGSSTSKSFSGASAKASNTYRYRVSACNNIGCSSSSAVNTIDVAIAPGTPSSISTASTNDGDYRITWGASSGSVTKYIFYYENAGSGNWTAVDRGTSTYIDLNLPAGTYRHKVIACKVVGSYTNCSGEKISGNTLVAAPSTVPGMNVAGSDSDGNYSVSWGAIANSTRYELQQNINGGSFSTVQNNSSTNKSFSGQSSRRYGYKVKACNNIGCTSYSTVNYINVAIQPGVPASLTAPQTSGGDTDLSWPAASGDVSYYDVIYKRTSDNIWSERTQINGLSTTLNNLSAGVYDHGVRACINVGGTVACSNYRYSQKTSVIKQVVNAYKYDALGRLVRVIEDSAVKTGYCYDPAGNRTVLTNNGGGENCPEPAHPDNPTGLNIATPGPNMYIASWNPSSGSTYYIFKYTAEIGQTSITIEGGNTTQITIDKDPQTYPPIYVQACNPFGCSNRVNF